MRKKMKRQRTSEGLKRSLLILLYQGSYAQISVNDIASHAGMCRQNFYNHYATKDQLMEETIDEFFEGLFDAVIRIETPSESIEEDMNTLYYSHFKSNSEFMNLLLTHEETSGLVLSSLRRYVTRMLGSALRRKNITVRNAQLIEYVRDYYVGGYYHIVVSWIKSGMVYDPSIMGRLHTQLQMSNVESVLDLVAD